MKRLIPVLSVLVLLTGTRAFALDDQPVRDDPAARAPRRTVILVQDVIRMSQAGVGDAAIIAYVQKSRDDFEVTADDIIAMNDARVSADVVRAVVDESAARSDRRRSDYRRDGDREVVRERVYVAPYGYGYDPWWYSPYYGYYDPFFYGPRFSIGIGLGFGYRGWYGGHYGGHYGGGHFRRHR